MLDRKSRSWVFTVNNPVRPWTEPPIDPSGWRAVPRFMVYQEEVGESGTPHFQGYVVFENPIKGSSLSARLYGHCGVRPHLEVRRGSHTQAKEYASKEDTRVSGPYVFGDDTDVAEGQGRRSDLGEIKRKIDEGATEIEIAQDHFAVWCQFSRPLKRYKSMVSPKRDWEMEVICLIGDTGVGKTRWAYEHYPDLYSVPNAKSSGTYWDGYDGQETVLIDEMYGHRFSHGFLLRLLDRYAFSVPTHGGAVNFCSRRVILTSNSNPWEWYDQAKFPFQNGPLERRMTQGASNVYRVDAGMVLVALY